MVNPLKKVLQSIFIKNWETNLKLHPIRWLELEVTKRCPYTCIHCGSSCSVNYPSDNELSSKEFIDIAKTIAAKYGTKNIAVAFTGGEPFARKDLLHIIANVTELGFKASVVSNGYFINEDIIKPLYASGIRSISISLDGMKDNHNWLRNHPESFDRAINAIKLLKDSGLFYVEVITTVNKRSINDIPYMYKMLSDIGVHGWRFGKTFPLGRAKNYPELFINSGELRWLAEYIIKLRKDKKRKIKDISYFEEGYFGDNLELLIRNYFVRCMAGINILTVLSDGSLTGCASNQDSFIEGNIRSDNIIEVWENKFLLYRDKSWMREGMCKECKVWNKCRGDGLHLWNNGKKNPALCNYNIYNGKD